MGESNRGVASTAPHLNQGAEVVGSGGGVGCVAWLEVADCIDTAWYSGSIDCISWVSGIFGIFFFLQGKH